MVLLAMITTHAGSATVHKVVASPVHEIRKQSKSCLCELRYYIVFMMV